MHLFCLDLKSGDRKSIDRIENQIIESLSFHFQTTYEYEAEYTRVRKNEYSRFHGYAYDGIWAIAFAIRSVYEKLRNLNSPLTLKDFRYRDPFWAQLFKEALNETQFYGVTVSLFNTFYNLHLTETALQTDAP
jgi:hypothetical protein